MSELVMIETCHARGGDTPDEYLRSVATLAAERGTDAAVVACDESGRLLTPPGFADTCLDVAPTGQLLACRRVTGGTFLDLPNVDYVTAHWPLACYQEPQRFGALENGSTHWLYTGRWDGSGYPRAHPTTPVWDAGLARFSPDGSASLFVEFRAQPAVFVWRENLATGERVAIAPLPQSVLLGDISFVGDGTWAVVGGGADMFLLNTLTGQFAQLPERFRAACWDPSGGPSALYVAQHTGRSSVLGTYSLATGEWNPGCEVEAQVLGLDLSADGDLAAVISGESTDHVPNVAFVDRKTGSYELARPLAFACGTTRRTYRPRWLSRPAPADEPTRLADGWVAALKHVRLTGTAEDAQKFLTEWVDRIGRRVEAVTADPWRTRVLNQLLALCFEARQLNPAFADAAQRVVSPRLREIASRPIDADLRTAYTRCADDIDRMMRE
jgi:hypothetical protein